MFGALLGKQNGRHLELFNSFELQHSESPEGGVVIEMEYFRNKEEQCEYFLQFRISSCFFVFYYF